MIKQINIKESDTEVSSAFSVLPILKESGTALAKVPGHGEHIGDC